MESENNKKISILRCSHVNESNGSDYLSRYGEDGIRRFNMSLGIPEFYGHWIEMDSICAEEKRHIEISTYSPWNDENKIIQEVNCFDCLVKKFCKRENCTNLRERCRYCTTIPEICFQCSNLQLKKCCINCTPCITCLGNPHENIVTDDMRTKEDEVKLKFPKYRCCLFCGEVVCGPLHEALECEQVPKEEKMSCMKEALQYMRDEVIEIKLMLNYNKKFGDLQ